MKALIRNESETVTEDMGILGIDWNTGMPLTNPVWAGGPYRLVDNYIEVTDYSEPEDPVAEDNVQDTIVIDGVTYTRTS